MSYEKIRAAIKFLKLDADGEYANISDTQIETLEDALKHAENPPRKTDTVANVLYDGRSDDGALLELTYLAEFGGKSVAAEACLKLAGFYCGLEDISGASGSKELELKLGFWDEIALGYLARAKKLLGNRNIPKRFDALLNRPRAGNSSDVYCDGAMVLPELEDIKENSNTQTEGLLSIIKLHVDRVRTRATRIRQQLEKAEASISNEVYTLSSKVDLTGERDEHKRRRSRWIRRIIVILILLLLLPGCLNGPGEGIQGFFYTLFLIPFAPHILQTYDVSSFAEFKNVILEDGKASTLYGVLLAALPLCNLVLSVILYFVSLFRAEYRLEREKQVLCEKYGIYGAIEEARKLYDYTGDSISKNEREKIVDLGVYDTYYILNELAIFYHMQRFCSDPDKTYARWREMFRDPILEAILANPSCSGGPSLYDRYYRPQSSSESSGWSWNAEVTISDNWGNSKTMDADMAHSLGYIDHDDYMKILSAKDEAEFEHRNKR